MDEGVEGEMGGIGRNLVSKGFTCHLTLLVMRHAIEGSSQQHVLNLVTFRKSTPFCSVG